jgi:hypothetical protein
MKAFFEKNHFDRADIENLIAIGAEESLNLEFKSSAALSRKDSVKDEISKDVSALANSNGGIIIYGINEHDFKATSISFVDGTDFTPEWLEQIISTRIQRKIEGVVIVPILFDDDRKKTVYLVKIPSSGNAPHMASDKRYYRRRNVTVERMDEYEIRNIYSKVLDQQQDLSNFFKLLETHKNMIDNLGKGELSAIGVSFIIGLPPYKKALQSRQLEDISLLSFSPYFLIEEKRRIFDEIANSIFHVIQFIEKKLNEKQFYHRTFYNTLSVSEKYFFGMYCHLGLFKESDFIKQLDFNYLDHYQNDDHFYDASEGVLPNITVRINPSYGCSVKDSPDSYPSLNLTNAHTEDITLLGLIFELETFRMETPRVMKQESRKQLIPGESTSINLYSPINDLFLKNVLGLVGKREISLIQAVDARRSLRIKLYIQHNGKKYNYWKHLQMRIENIESDSPYLSIVT